MPLHASEKEESFNRKLDSCIYYECRIDCNQNCTQTVLVVRWRLRYLHLMAIEIALGSITSGHTYAFPCAKVFIQPVNHAIKRPVENADCKPQSVSFIAHNIDNNNNRNAAALLYLQFSCVQWDISWDLLETSGRTIDGGAFAMTCRRTFGIDATFASKSGAVFVVTCVRDIWKRN